MVDEAPPVARDARPRPENGMLADDLSFLLARATALSVASGNAALAKHDLKVRSYSVLALAVDGSRPSQREVAHYLLLDPSQVVALVDDLERRGLVRREVDPGDRRTNLVLATPSGHELFLAAQASVTDAAQALHSAITPSERRVLGELLTKLAFPG